LSELPQGAFDGVRFIPPAPGRQAVKVKVGIPIPVPEFLVRPEEEYATQQQVNSAAVAGEGTVGDGESLELVPEEGAWEEGPVTVFEKAPALIRKVDPHYPEIARAAGVEGSVSVKMLITKEGKVGEVVIVKSDSELFNEAVLDAARQWAFVPAMMNKGPVSVWWSVDFNFNLR
jgi:periplasmic protein TonB